MSSSGANVSRKEPLEQRTLGPGLGPLESIATGGSPPEWLPSARAGANGHCERQVCTSTEQNNLATL